MYSWPVLCAIKKLNDNQLFYLPHDLMLNVFSQHPDTYSTTAVDFIPFSHREKSFNLLSIMRKDMIIEH